MRVPAHRAVLAAVSAVAAAIFVSGAAAASLTPAAPTDGAPAGRRPGRLRVRARPEHGQGGRHLLPVLHRRPGRHDRERQYPDPDLDRPAALDPHRHGVRGQASLDHAALGSIPNLWAPDISYFGGRWHLYLPGSSFGSNNSVIGLASTPTLDPHSPRYHWTDDGQVFRSSTADDYNAIDPSLVSTPSGARYLVFGSYWSGIKLLQLDPATGKPATPPRRSTRWPSGPRRTPWKAPGSPTTTATTTCSCPSTPAAPGSAAPTGSWPGGRHRLPGRMSTPAAHG